jgi:riboflavin synthase
MFTGIVEEMGVVRSLERRGEAARLVVAAGPTLAESGIGRSVAVNGACLTVVARDREALAFDLGPETLRSTTLGELGSGDPVNLERPLHLGGELDGHLVLGHVDGVGVITEVDRFQTTARLRIALGAPELEPLLIPKGSVAVDGVSLTVAELSDTAFEVMIVPHTLAVTTLGRAAPGRRVNLEMDVIGKYVLRSLVQRGIA